MFPKGVKRRTVKRALQEQRAEELRRARVRFFVSLAARQGRPYAACEVCEDSPATSLHHKRGRDGSRLIDEEEFMGVCDPCHGRIHANPAWAYEQGFLLSRNATEGGSD